MYPPPLYSAIARREFDDATALVAQGAPLDTADGSVLGYYTDTMSEGGTCSHRAFLVWVNRILNPCLKPKESFTSLIKRFLAENRFPVHEVCAFLESFRDMGSFLHVNEREKLVSPNDSPQVTDFDLLVRWLFSTSKEGLAIAHTYSPPSVQNFYRVARDEDALLALVECELPPTQYTEEGYYVVAKALYGVSGRWKDLFSELTEKEIYNLFLIMLRLPRKVDFEHLPLFIDTVFTLPKGFFRHEDISAETFPYIIFNENRKTCIELFFQSHKELFVALLEQWFPKISAANLPEALQIALLYTLHTTNRALLETNPVAILADIQNLDSKGISFDLLFAALDARQVVEMLEHALGTHFFHRIFTVTAVPIEDNGRLQNFWEGFLKALLAKLEQVQIPELPFNPTVAKVSQISFHSWQRKRKRTLYTQAGRTEVYRYGNGYLYFKWQRPGEDISALTYEFARNLFLRQAAHFRSAPPKPLRVFKVDGQHVFIYKSRSLRPITYAHDPELNFRRAQWRYMYDIGMLMRSGFIYTALSDLFHNDENPSERSDSGRYMPMAGLIRDHFLGEGAGRVTGWLPATMYPNVGWGLRDLADIAHVNNLANPAHPYYRSHLTEVEERETSGPFPSVQTLLKANAFGEALLVDMLIIGQRFKGCWNRRDDCQKVAHFVLRGCALLMEGYTGRSYKECKALLNTSIIQWERLGMQMLFWMNNTESGYLPFVRDGIPLPPHLYECQASVANKEDMRGWSDTLGFALNDKDADLGTVNGPFPIVEAVKLWYYAAAWSEVWRVRDQLDRTPQDP